MNKLQWNVNQNSYSFIQESPFENVVWKIAAILSRPPCVIEHPLTLVRQWLLGFTIIKDKNMFNIHIRYQTSDWWFPAQRASNVESVAIMIWLQGTLIMRKLVEIQPVWFQRGIPQGCLLLSAILLMYSNFTSTAHPEGSKFAQHHWGGLSVCVFWGIHDPNHECPSGRGP